MDIVDPCGPPAAALVLWRAPRRPIKTSLGLPRFRAARSTSGHQTENDAGGADNGRRRLQLQLQGELHLVGGTLCSGEISCSFIFISIYFWLSCSASHLFCGIRLHSLALQPQADLEDPLLNPSLWPPSTLVRWGEGLAMPAIAVAALVANVVLLRCISISL